jgi:hypothetical protein
MYVQLRGRKVLVDKLIVVQLVKKLHVFYGSQSLITVFGIAHRWTLS